MENKEATDLAHKYGVSYKEVSAKNGKNVIKLFKEITKSVFKLIDQSNFLVINEVKGK